VAISHSQPIKVITRVLRKAIKAITASRGIQASRNLRYPEKLGNNGRIRMPLF
jgi:hypothetical protein